jgi:hypothetical protein
MVDFSVVSKQYPVVRYAIGRELEFAMRITRSLLVLATFDSIDGLVGLGQTMAQLILRERMQFLAV